MSRQQAIELKIKKDREIALKAGRKLAKCEPGDEIVLSGFSGSFPDSDGLPNFAESLFNKVDLISADHRRWNLGKTHLIAYLIVIMVIIRLSVNLTSYLLYIFHFQNIRKFLNGLVK